MDSKNIILTVGIPTFNSCEYLKGCIETILTQHNVMGGVLKYWCATMHQMIILNRP